MTEGRTILDGSGGASLHGGQESTLLSMLLPLIRTSVDHGTALDLAGQGLGLADCGSMEQAIASAVAMANAAAAAAAAAAVVA